jgi:hypothetical protein
LKGALRTASPLRKTTIKAANATPERDDKSDHPNRLFTLRRKESLRETGITHVLSVLKLPVEQGLFDGFTHMAVEVDDVDDENLLEHFPECNRFINAAIEAGGSVLIHW